MSLERPTVLRAASRLDSTLRLSRAEATKSTLIPEMVMICASPNRMSGDMLLLPLFAALVSDLALTSMASEEASMFFVSGLQ